MNSVVFLLFTVSKIFLLGVWNRLDSNAVPNNKIPNVRLQKEQREVL